MCFGIFGVLDRFGHSSTSCSFLCLIGGAAWVSERGVLVRKEIAVESGRACATDRGSGGLGLAEGIVFRAVLSRRLSEDKYEFLGT